MSLDDIQQGPDSIPTDPTIATHAAPAVSTPVPAPTRVAPAAQTLGTDYMSHRQDMEGKAALEEMMAAVRQTSQPAKSPAAAPQSAEGATPQPSAALPYDPRTGAINIAGSTGPAAAGAVASDVGMGIVDSPRAIYKGARDAYQSMIDGAADLGRWLEKAGDIPGLKVDSSGIQVVSGEELQSLPRPLEGKELPNIGEPTSVTGGVLKNAVQFITSVATVGRVFGLEGAGVGLAGRLASSGKGAAALFAGFEGSQRRLSDLVQSVPALQNPITDFLASKPDDNEAVGRLKNAVEGTVVGQLADGLVQGLRVLRAGQAAQDAAESVPAPAAPALSEDAFKTLGDEQAAPDAPLVQTSTQGDPFAKRYAAAQATQGVTPGQVEGMKAPAAEGDVAGPASPGATEAQAQEPKVYFNFARIDGPDDIKRMMSQLTDTIAERKGATPAGDVRDFETVKLDAASEDAWQTLMTRRQGEPLTDSQTQAARELWKASADKLGEVSQLATQSPTEANLFAFRKMVATHAAINEEVLGARAAAARSLGAWRIPVGDEGAWRLNAITNAVQQTGGLQVNLDFARRIAALSTADMPEEMNAFIEKGAYATTRDAVLEAWTNGLLTNPMTHVRVIGSNSATIALRIAERAVGAKISSVLGDEGGVAAGEAAAQYAGLVGGLKDAFRYVGQVGRAFLNEEPIPPLGSDPASMAVKAAKTGQYTQDAANMPDQSYSFPGAISSEAFGMSDSGWVGRGLDLLGQVVRSPGRALTAEHDFFRSIGYRMELNAQAVRQATAEVNRGDITREEFPSRVAEIVADPPSNVHTAAVDGMLYQTFTDAPGKLGELVEQLRQTIPETRVLLPFYKIPGRMLAFTFERTPLAPLMSKFRADVAAGGPRQALALAQVGLGTEVMLATADAVLSGQVTGSGPVAKGQRLAMENQGWLPYSMKVGDRWVQYNKLETVGSSLALAADLVDTIRNYHTAVNADDPDIESLSVAGVLAVAQDITSKTYLTGLSNFFEMMADPKTRGQGTLRSLAGSVVPAGVNAIARAEDPYTREVYSMMDAIKARTPGASESLPPMRNVWGEPVSHESGLGKAYDMLVPFASREPKDEPIDRELLRLGSNITLPPAKTSFNGVTIDLRKDPQMYSRYVELAGNALENPAWGMGAKDLLNAIVSGNHPLSDVYNMRSDGPDGGKDVMIKDIIRQYREQARAKLLEEYPQLATRVNDQQEKQRAMQISLQ